MDKSCHSTVINSSSPTMTATTNAATATATAASAATTTTATTTTTQIQTPLNHLNRSSYKIAKPIPKIPIANPIRSPPPPPSNDGGGGAQQQQAQPPVYNIDKNDFRDVVQRLTGSPAHHPAAPPQPPPAAPGPTHRPPISRLHRIRPPPLAHLSPLPPPLAPAGDGWQRPLLSPLPPLPTVSAAAESPITAYMRRLRGGGGGGGAPALSPGLPPSPLAFGCVPSPRTAYQMMFPTSPRMPMSSPK